MHFHYTWEFARHFYPVLRWGHESGFFNFYIYLPIMTVPAIALFWWVYSRARRNNAVTGESSVRRFSWYALYFYVSWMACSTFAVAFKTMIVEELVYQERKWFEPYLPGIHFVVAGASLAYLALVTQPKFRSFYWFLYAYLQVALIAGFAVAGYRATHEDFEGALGGVILLLLFAVCNYDVLKRLRNSFSSGIPIQVRATA